MSIEKYPKDKVDDLLSVYTEQKGRQVSEWCDQVRDTLLSWMKYYPHKRVHSVRTRIKEKSHLRDKIERWPQTHEPKDELTKHNFFEKIEDLAGVRVLVLYRHDVAIVDHFVYRSSQWKVLKAEANYDKDRSEDGRFFEELEFEENAHNRHLERKRSGYASVHYILVRHDISDEAAKSTHKKCELQVRTIHEEAWSEFSHEFTYPRDYTDPLASKLIKRLSGLLHQAEDIVSDIRRSPADGSLFRRVHQQLWEDGITSRLPPLITFDVVHEILTEVQFMTRSAPLAAVAILVEYGGTKGSVERGTTINAQEIITLGFGAPENWSEDELQKLYLEAHANWYDQDEHRKIFKFFIWSPPQPKTKDKSETEYIIEVPKLFQLFSDKINFLLVRRDAYDEVHRVLLEELKLNLHMGYSLKPIQFFLWRTNTTYNHSKLPCLVGMTSNKIIGFYSPFSDPDLLSGMLWLPDEEGEEKTTKVLHAYADVLMAMKDNTTLVPRLTGDKVQVSGTLTDGSKEMIRNYVTEKFKGLK